MKILLFNLAPAASLLEVEVGVVVGFEVEVGADGSALEALGKIPDVTEDNSEGEEEEEEEEEEEDAAEGSRSEPLTA